ncbi:unnamed protein product [Didymodactylos carnosus]|uniref:HAT C-terminal dimerisation domain-containing protein n=1 Tax=Didymodactylos carnosus TaxID=1234261 RepID=A0A8S2EDC2_9BILA|nr:unnamed protein product [Didymodactylos carnosus]CAF3901211.1 unnamed protein product [Didymodactylos carnosus]
MELYEIERLVGTNFFGLPRINHVFSVYEMLTIPFKHHSKSIRLANMPSYIGYNPTDETIIEFYKRNLCDCAFGTVTSCRDVPAIHSTLSNICLDQILKKNKLSSCVSYGGVTLHYIDSAWRLKTFNLACRAYDPEFNPSLNKNIYILSDNENLMKATFREKRIGCGTHYSNKILEHALMKDDINCSDVQKLFLSVKAIVNHVKRSHKQAQLRHKLQSFSDTRFNGVFVMTKSILTVYDELTDTVQDEMKNKLSDIDKSLLQFICSYLKNFNDVTEGLSADQNPTIYEVIPLHQMLVHSSLTTTDNTEAPNSLKEYIGKELLSNWIITDEHYLCVILHPLLTNFQTLPDFKQHSYAVLQNKIKKVRNSDNNTTQPIDSSATSSSSSPTYMATNDNRRSLLSNFFDTINLNSVPKDEFHLYIESTVTFGKDETVLDYWKKNETVYPTISKIAKRILAIPATDTSAERLFSQSGNTVTNRRTRLGTDKVNQLMFLRKI